METGQNISWHSSKVTSAERAVLHGQNALTVWMTGLSASGKSTLAYELERRLHDFGHGNFVLDGDNVRHGLSRDLGFSHDNRKENIRRVAEVAKLFNDAGIIVITALISPYRDDRAVAQEILGAERFVEIHLAADITVCERRDPRGLYGRARAGEIADFTGISAPYEAPLSPALRLDTGVLSVGQCIENIIANVLPRLRNGHSAFSGANDMSYMRSAT